MNCWPPCGWRGHQLKPLASTYGNMQAIYWDRRQGEVFSASDPRGIGAARVKAVQ